MGFVDTKNIEYHHNRPLPLFAGDYIKIKLLTSVINSIDKAVWSN